RERVLIFGDGPIGLLTLMCLRHAGVQRIAMVGGRSGRLALARELGVTAAFHFAEFGENLIPAVQEKFGDSFPAIIETSGGVAGSWQCVMRGNWLAGAASLCSLAIIRPGQISRGSCSSATSLKFQAATPAPGPGTKPLSSP